MKSKFMITMMVALALFSSCELIPDLNPNTNAGADITVIEIGDTLIEKTIGNVKRYSINYDLNDDNITDILFEENNFGDCSLFGASLRYEIRVRGKVLSKALPTDFLYISLPSGDTISHPVSLSNNNAATSLFSDFRNDRANLIYGYSSVSLLTCPESWTSKISNGINKYIMFKIQDNGNEFYGWIEYFSDLIIENEVEIVSGRMILKRIGISNEPGYVLRTGQTE